ncbi:hypothetical protein CLF_105195 [Clonorchis sinensis]|uniref:Uncharacterized protein n=1 Tax=Clonorchis sinensis TaxID=79923 RepID=G7YD62_CLOSI|nr:hypothetical protein CLF_105195 [Clonorchis sinensis]
MALLKANSFELIFQNKFLNAVSVSILCPALGTIKSTLSLYGSEALVSSVMLSLMKMVMSTDRVCLAMDQATEKASSVLMSTGGIRSSLFRKRRKRVYGIRNPPVVLTDKRINRKCENDYGARQLRPTQAIVRCTNATISQGANFRTSYRF